jgi:zinc-binding in reverse transcriptase
MDLCHRSNKSVHLTMHALPLIHDLAPDRAIQPLPTLTEECDSIEWRWAENKQYTAKSAYEKLSGGGKIKDANVQIWKTKTPPTVTIFCFLLLRGKILTRDVLSKQKIHCQMNCVMCLNCGMETAIHLLFRCEYAASVWDELNRRMGFQCVLNQEDVLSIWEKLIKDTRGKPEKWKTEGPVLILCACWYIWNQRNSVIFRSVRKKPPDILVNLILAQWEWWLRLC